jgi:hypothetical protein
MYTTMLARARATRPVTGARLPRASARSRRFASSARAARSASDPESASSRARARATAALPRRRALLGALGISLGSALPASHARASPFDDFAASQLQAKSKIFMGPLQTTLERLRALRDAEAAMDDAALADALGAATLDCLNPRGPLAAYASVRDVCTLRILVKSATLGPAARHAPEDAETRNVKASLDALQASYDSLAEALAGDPSDLDPTARDAAFDACVSELRAFAAALLACFPLDDARAEETRAAFPELFA